MAKAKKQTKKETVDVAGLIDLFGFALAGFFTYTVIGNARDLLNRNVNSAPSVYALVAVAAIVVWSAYKNDGKLTRIGLLTLTVAATSGAIWLFGLHA